MACLHKHIKSYFPKLCLWPQYVHQFGDELLNPYSTMFQIISTGMSINDWGIWCLSNWFWNSLKAQILHEGRFPFQKDILIVNRTPDIKSALFTLNLSYTPLSLQYTHPLFLNHLEGCPSRPYVQGHPCSYIWFKSYLVWFCILFILHLMRS